MPNAPDLGAGPALLGVRLNVAAALAAVVGCVYLFAVPTELERWVPYAGGFLVIGLGLVQLSRALLDRPSNATLLMGIWLNLAVAGLYLGSRTDGLPFGPVRQSHLAHASEHAQVAGGIGNGVPFLPRALDGTRIESVGSLDLAVIAVQFGLVVVLVSLLSARSRRWTTNLMGLAGLILWVARWLGVLG